MSLGRLVVELALDSQDFEISMRRANGELTRFSQRAQTAGGRIDQAEHSTRSWGRTLRDTVITLALVRSALQNVSAVSMGWQKSIIDVNGEIQRSIALMKSFSGSTDEMVRTQEAIADVRMLMQKAASAPFDMNAITDSFVKLRVAGIEDTRRSMDVLVDSVAAFGGTSDNLKRAGVAIQQMAGKGVVSMEELRQQLGESVPSAIQAMADGLGTSYDVLVKQISLGRVKAAPAIKAMMDELERQFAGRAETMMDTVAGSVAQFQTSLKMLATSFGGLTDSGYAEGGYMSTITSELQSITDLLNSPEMIDGARQLGDAMAQLVSVAADGVKYIIANREAIVDWGKALLTVFAIMKGASILAGLIRSFGAISVAIKNAAFGATQASLAFNQLRGAMESQAAAAARQAAANAAGAQVITRLGLAATAARTALSVLTGPIGIVAGLAISGGIAWNNYRTEVDQTRLAVLDLNQALTSREDLNELDKMIRQYENKMAEARGRINRNNNSIYADSIFGDKTDENAEQARLIQKYGTVVGDLIAKRGRDIEEIARRSSQAYIISEQRNIRRAFAEVSSTYKVESDKLLNQRRANEISETEYDTQKRELMQQNGERLLTMLEARLAEQREVNAKLDQEAKAAGVKVSEDTLARMYASQEIIESLEDQVRNQKEALVQNMTLLENILIGGGGGGMDMKFNPLTKYFESLSVAVAKAGAKAKEENPHLAQLNQIVENMQMQDMKVDQTLVTHIEQLAAKRWEQEKATKALNQATTSYKDNLERLSQIEKLASAKLNKAENENPWLNASADAQRYREELVKMEEALAKAQATAQEIKEQGLIDTELPSEIEAITSRIDALRQKLDEVSVADASKKMRDDIKAINLSLMTETERTNAMYQEQIAQAEEYFARHKEELLKSATDYQTYTNYLEALRQQNQRANENGLQEWIRENRDATQEYKQLWGSAMNSFVGTVTDGLIEGKLQFKDFVEEILKEIMRIMVAKAIAGLATSAMGMFGGGAPAGGAGAGASTSNAQFSQLGGRYESSVFAYANGGVMTKWGNAKLKEYAKGGIARSPQVAVFGEGDMAEAYVPLPDGRSIPVTLQGNLTGGASSAQPPVVNVNVINQSSQEVNAEQSGSQFNGEQFVVDVVLKNISKPGPLRDAVRSN